MYIFDHYIPYRNYYKNTFVSLQNNNLVAFGQFINKDFVIVAPYASYSSASYIIVDVSQSAFISSNVIPSNLQPYQFYIINTDIYNTSNTNINPTSSSELSAFMQYYYSVAQSQTSATLTAYTSLSILSNISGVVNSTYVSITLPGGTIDPIYLNYNGDVTSWPTTYTLSLYQSLIVSFNNSRVMYIPLQLTGKDIYRFYLTQNINAYNSGTTTTAIPVLLHPNNQSASIIYIEMLVEYNNGNITTDVSNGYYSGFRLTSGLGSTDATLINNSPFTKTVWFTDVELGASYDPQAHLPAQIWDDYTTIWNMFGTLVLSQAASGYFIITRLA